MFRYAPIRMTACLLIGTMATVVLMTPSVQAQATQGSSARPKSNPGEKPNNFGEAITEGEPIFNLRLRAEHVQQDGVEDATAATGRLRLGYESADWNGLSFLTEMETVQALNDETYNYPGGGDPQRAVIADPPDTELNRAWVQYQTESDKASVKLGRQRIILDNARLVGNVGWRQNEQTFDAVTLRGTPTDQLELFYGYVWDVNRIFGPDAEMDFESDTHLLNGSYQFENLGKLAAFSYLIDLDNSPANSSNTVGLRFTGDQALNERWTVGYEASYAYQVDAGDNPNDYAANYYKAGGSLKRTGWGTLALGYEVLGSDDGNAAFRTPLATLHAFQGWADVFLTTPNVGVRDLYVSAGTTLPYDIKGKLIYHWFEADEGGSDLGQEIDGVLKKQFTERWSALTKFAWYEGDGGFTDRTKFWVQTTFAF